MCSRIRQGALLYLPVDGQREDTLAQGDFGEWMLKHIDGWFAFARRLGLGIEQMEEIVLVTGYDRTRSWANAAFLGSHANARVSFGARVDNHNTSIEFQSLPGHVHGAVLKLGPEGMVRSCLVCKGRRTREFDIDFFCPLEPTR